MKDKMRALFVYGFSIAAMAYALGHLDVSILGSVSADWPNGCCRSTQECGTNLICKTLPGAAPCEIRQVPCGNGQLCEQAVYGYCDKRSSGAGDSPFTFPVYNDLSPHSTSSYKLGGTPQTLVISSEGRILKSWFGAYSGPVAQEVEEYFSIRLPGIIQDQAEQRPDEEECKTCEDDKPFGS